MRVTEKKPEHTPLMKQQLDYCSRGTESAYF